MRTNANGSGFFDALSPLMKPDPCARNCSIRHVILRQLDSQFDQRGTNLDATSGVHIKQSHRRTPGWRKADND